MKNVLHVVVVLCFLAGLCGSAVAAVPLAYDAGRAAIAVDPYFDGFGGSIELDFNSDHSYAAIIDQSGWHYLYGNTTAVGLYYTTTKTYPGGGSSTSTVYGWGQTLGTLAPVFNYSSLVSTLYYGQETLDKYYYFTDEWNVANGKTVIYVQPASGSPAAGARVESGDLDNVYFRINKGTWQKFMDVYPWQPPLPLAAAISINPETLNLKSNGKWITVYVTPPQGYTAADIDLASVALSMETAMTRNGSIEEQLVYRAGPSEVIASSTGTQLMVKFDRSTVSGLVSPGEAVLAVSGRLVDGHAFRGTDAIRVR